MPLFLDRKLKQLNKAGWHSRGYLPHFDGRPTPQFITFHLADSIPHKVIDRWKQELRSITYLDEKLCLQKRIERYLDLGYGQAFLKVPEVAWMVQDSLLKFDVIRYRLFAWVVMPNHVHTLMSRFDENELRNILHSIKSYTAHEANKILGRVGQFWIEDYFDRFMRNQRHFERTVRYIENNPVKAGLCREPGDWPYSSAWFKKHKPGG